MGGKTGRGGRGGMGGRIGMGGKSEWAENRNGRKNRKGAEWAGKSEWAEKSEWADFPGSWIILRPDQVKNRHFLYTNFDILSPKNLIFKRQGDTIVYSCLW